MYQAPILFGNDCLSVGGDFNFAIGPAKKSKGEGVMKHYKLFFSLSFFLRFGRPDV